MKYITLCVTSSSMKGRRKNVNIKRNPPPVEQPVRPLFSLDEAWTIVSPAKSFSLLIYCNITDEQIAVKSYRFISKILLSQI